MMQPPAKSDRRRFKLFTRSAIIATSTLLVAFGLSGCGEEKSNAQTAAAPPAPVVTVAKPVKKLVSDYDEYVGRFIAVDFVEVRARVSGYLERVGDYAKGVARRLEQVHSPAERQAAKMLGELGARSYDMLVGALNAYAARDPQKAKQIYESDARIDEEYRRVFLVLLTQMANDAATIPVIGQLLLAAKSLERVGDQATNIAEMVYFTYTSEKLESRHTAG